MKSEENNCMVSCTGLYADLEHTYHIDSKGQSLLEAEYSRYKTNYAKNIIFDPSSKNLSTQY